ncbi:hypothetical protein [Priestia megaterium]
MGNQLSFMLPEIDRKETQQAVEDALEKYRLFKYLYFNFKTKKLPI